MTSAMDPTIEAELAAALNEDCDCVSLDRAALERTLAADPNQGELFIQLLATRPYLFSNAAVFVSRHHIERMRALIRAVESVVRLPAYRAEVLRAAPASAAHDPGPLGVFFGYDFHITPDGPRLIEINTNAGGALLNVALARAQQACCPSLQARVVDAPMLAGIEERLIEMFRAEWRRQRGTQSLRHVAIVDDDPAGQFLYPEFLLFERLFRDHDLAARIIDARELSIADGALVHAGTPIDLVYNRVTDFALDEPGHAALRRAWLEDLAVVTPHPRAHALYADKHNLALLTDTGRLHAWGVSEADIATLREAIPATWLVDPAHADDLWARRKSLFFKPLAGYGGKAAYRGDKLTRRVFGDILAGQYVAQQLVTPSERRVRTDGGAELFKVDVRNVVYDGQVQLMAARLYQGQTTNFRTPGGGFAPVFTVAGGAS